MTSDETRATFSEGDVVRFTKSGKLYLVLVVHAARLQVMGVRNGKAFGAVRFVDVDACELTDERVALPSW